MNYRSVRYRKGKWVDEDGFPSDIQEVIGDDPGLYSVNRRTLED